MRTFRLASLSLLALTATFASGQTTTGTISPTTLLTDGALLVGNAGSCYEQTSGGYISFSTPTNYSLTSFAGIPFTNTYTFLARDGASGVAIALAPSVAADAIAGGKTWSQVLGGLTQAQAYTELTNLYAGTSNNSLFSFFTANRSLFPDFNTAGTLVRFSPAASGGSITNVTPVPEPSTWAGLALGGLALLRRSKRRD